VAEEETQEEFARRLEEELKRIKVADLLVQTIYTVSSLGYRRLGEEDRDLEQAHLAIEALKALVPVLEGTLPEEMVRDLNQVTANMQLAYAKAASEQPSDSADE
jgi:hypothetical protein